MPRPLVFGNGLFLIQLDARHRIRDLFFPHVGQYNHLAGHSIRMGVWRDGQFSWCDSDEWEIEQAYEKGTMVGRSRLRCEGMAIELELVEQMAPRERIFRRQITLFNRGPAAEIRIFFSHDLRLNESDIGDTALYHPQSGSIVHYKNNTAIAFRGKWGDKGIFQYRASTRGQDLWDDAIDGELNMNPIEQGSVGSVMSLRSNIGAGQSSLAEYWITAHPSVDALLAHHFPFEIEPARAREPLQNDSYDEMLQRSLDVIASQCDRHGAILAANDSDILETARATYSYLWMRDGALVSSVLDKTHYLDISTNFFEFSAKVTSRPPMFRHKYSPDGSLGASWHPYIFNGEPITPFQEDSTALTIWAMASYAARGVNRNAIELWYRWVRQSCDFMATYVDDSGLPEPSWDLWEERRGVHAYTAATVIAGLRAGASLAKQLGKEADGIPWLAAADRMSLAIKERMWNAERGCFTRMIGDTTADSATLAFGLFGIFPPDDPMVVQNASTIEEVLTVRGGLARYEDDYYFRQRGGYAGNPWVITTMWLAQTRILQGNLEAAERALQWVREHQAPTGILAEQYHPDTGAPLSVSPLTWSHAEVVRTIQMLRHARSTLGI
ncbi:MAG: glycoside hydrolase family 15 protein [Chthonomonas sp.]|nr:glycoside hydrolase family 15 protein [Chthonomonas sp.]